MEPPITPAMPATVGPMLTMTFLTAENTEPILENASASFGNSSARTSENVPAPPERSWNPSTSFGTTPTAVFTWPAKELTADVTILTLPAAAFAVFIVIMAAAIVPRAFPNVSITAGSAPARVSNIPWTMLITPPNIGSSVDAKPSNSPLRKAPRDGNSSLIP